MKKSVSIKAPCRIDLAGGTIDLWPLYLYFGGHTLCHMAVDIFTEVKISFEARKQRNIHIEINSFDLKENEAYTSLKSIKESLKKDTAKVPTRWINRLCVEFIESSFKKLPTGTLKIECKSKAPPGSGLGGSSVLGVALWSGFEKLFLKKAERTQPWDVQRKVRDLEAVEIEHPAGDQDYVPALFGGLLLFNLSYNHRSVKKVKASTAKKLAERLALVYTGERHHSGINNWELFTNFHKWGHPCRDHLKKIHTVSAEMAESLANDKISNFPGLLNKEWSSRKLLGEAVNAPSLKRAWTFAKSHGATARKACGAGGGGCLLVYFPSKTKRDTFLKEKPRNRFELYAVNVVSKGLY
ncbi:hypothetical protein GW915_01790 [bacterium]|nr:hypothetical protein [bacterium]